MIKERRTLLTTREDLLKMRGVVRGYLLRNDNPCKQLKEVIEHFDLYNLMTKNSK